MSKPLKISHDIHIHNFLSTCSSDNCATVESYIEIVKNAGLSIMGFANHTWDESVPLPTKFEFYRYQSLTFQQQIKSQIPEHIDGLRVLVGAETEYCGMYDCLGMSAEGIKKLDFLLIPHSHVHMRDFVMPTHQDVTPVREAIAKRLAEQIDWLPKEYALTMAKALPREALKPFMTEQVDRVRFVSDFLVKSFDGLMKNKTLNSFDGTVPISVAHPFQPVAEPHRPEIMKLISDNTFGELFSQAAERGIGLEINPWTIEDDVRMFGIAKECGCKFTFGSDAHSRGELKNVFGAQRLADTLGLTEDDVMDFLRT